MEWNGMEWNGMEWNERNRIERQHEMNRHMSWAARGRPSVMTAAPEVEQACGAHISPSSAETPANRFRCDAATLLVHRSGFDECTRATFLYTARATVRLPWSSLPRHQRFICRVCSWRVILQALLRMVG